MKSWSFLKVFYLLTLQNLSYSDFMKIIKYKEQYREPEHLNFEGEVLRPKDFG